MSSLEFTPTQKWRPTKDVRVSPREILRVGTLFLEYRTFDDGRDLPRIGKCTAWTFTKWVKRWGSELVPKTFLLNEQHTVQERRI